MIDENKLIEDIMWKVKEQVFKSEEVGYNRPFCDKANVIECISNQPKIGEWIPCSERMPEVPEGIEYDDCPEFNVTIKGAKEATTLRCNSEGTWFDDNGYVYPVIAWQLLPEAYNEELSGGCKNNGKDKN